MTEPTPQEIAARVRGMAQELAEARAALHLKPGQPLGDRIRGLTEELDGRATSIAALRGDLDAVRAALHLAERKATDRASERSAMWDVLLAVREASGAGAGEDLRAVVASLRAEAAHALPSRMSGLPQPAVTVTPDGRVKVEIRHTNDLALEYLHDRPEAARLVHDLSLAVARLTPGGPRLGVNADPGEGATLGICVEIAGEVLHLSPALRMEGLELEALVRELTAALPPVKHAGEHLEPLLAPLRPAGVLGRGELTEATPARVIQLVLERVNADRREIERLRAANAEHVARLASGTSGAGKRKRIAALEAQVEVLKREVAQAGRAHEPQRRTIEQWSKAAAEVIGRAEGLGLRMATGASPHVLQAAGQDLAAKAARVAGLEDLLARERAKTLEARAELATYRADFELLRSAARTMLPEGSTPNPATGWLADVIRGAAKRAENLAGAALAASARADALEAEVARLTQPPATIALPPALRPALDAVQDIVTGVEATPEGLGAGVIELVAELRKARRGWAEESAGAARARTELAEREEHDSRYHGHLPTARTMGAIAKELERIAMCDGNEGNLARIFEGVRATVNENRRLAAELSKRADPEAVRKISAQAGAARQLADEVRSWESWATEQIGTYPIGSRGLRATLAERLAKALADRDASRRAAEELRKALAAVGDLTA